MSLIRATLLLCITALLCVGAVTFCNYKKDRYEIVAINDGVFVFDRQTSASNFCNSSKCIVLSSEFLIPQKILVAEIPGVITKTQVQSQNPTVQGANPHSQHNLVNPNFNQATMGGQNQNNMGQNFGLPQQNMPQNQNNFNDGQGQNNDNGFQDDGQNDNGQDNAQLNGNAQDQGNNNF